MRCTRAGTTPSSDTPCWKAARSSSRPTPPAAPTTCAQVERALDGLARYRVREHQDPEVALREAGAPSRRSGSPARKDDPTPPELVEALKDLKRRHMEEWLDTPIPALSGMTPREAAAKPRKRKELVLLLKEIENHESRAPKEQ